MTAPPSSPPPGDDLALQKRLVGVSIVVILGVVALLNVVVPPGEEGEEERAGEDTSGSRSDGRAASDAPSGRRAPRGVPADAAALDPGVKSSPDRKVAWKPRRAAPAPPPAEDEEESEFDVHSPDREGITAAVNERIEEIRHCYEQWLKWKPTIEGTVVVTFTIDVPDEEDPARGPNGVPLASITDVGLEEDEVGHLWMEGCVLGVFETLRFDRPDSGPLVVNYPLRFEPAERP